MKTRFPYTRLALVVILLATFAVSIVAAFLLRFNFELPARYDRYLFFALALWPALKLLLFALRGFVHGWWRHVSLDDVLRLVWVNLIAEASVTIVTVFLAPEGFPRSIYVLDFLICVALTCGLRISRRVRWEYRRGGQHAEQRTRTLIYGAGDAGISLLRELRQNPSLPYEPVGLLDDDRGKKGNSVLGCRVLGSGQELAELVHAHAVSTVLIAIPSAPGPTMVRILRACRDAGVEFKTVPSLGEILEENKLARQIRDVAVEDLLNRPPAHLDHEAISARLTGRTILVTGAGGSIGSELCRQIAVRSPRALIGFDIAETPLFQIEREMKLRFPDLAFRAEIGSIGNAQRLGEVLARYRPAVVLHAAAYKHVPMMEAHVFEAVENNVFGTFQLATACMRAQVPEFVMISTDKAVRPTNVMGATKRVAELVVGALNAAANSPSATHFLAVRFGNVLGSNGSVVPTFREQIARGGPVTVTHPEIRRFFMTIPEAAQLVLQATALSHAGGHGGEVFVLDMGESVKIVDLARNLILLSGLRPDEDLHIEFTGLRPGEKLYEELSFLDEETVPTAHERVRCFTGAHITQPQLELHLQRLQKACQERSLRGVIFELKEMVPDYNPSSFILQQMMDGQPTLVETPATSTGAIGASA